jgi:hypothetical protein
VHLNKINTFLFLAVSFSTLLLGFGDRPCFAASCGDIQQQIGAQEAALKALRRARWKRLDEHLKKESDALAEGRSARADEEQARDELQAGKCYVLSNRDLPDCKRNAGRVKQAKARSKRAEQEFQRLRRTEPERSDTPEMLETRNKRDQLRRKLETCKKGSASSDTVWVPIPGPPANPCPYVPGWNMPEGAKCSGGSSGPPPAPGSSAASGAKSPAGSGGTQPQPPGSGKCTIGNTLVGQGCVQ